MFAGRSGPSLAAVGLILGAAGVLEVLGRASVTWVAATAVVGGGWAFFVLFLRDPERLPGPGVVSAADGVVRAVVLSGEMVSIEVFMNVYDVHVNRFPIDAAVVSIRDSGRGHRFAFDAGAAHNVQRSYHLTTSIGDVEVVQMTGWFARRLVSYVAPGSTLPKGSRLGMIVFGSRVDVRLPANRVKVRVHPGERVRAGATQLAEIV